MIQKINNGQSNVNFGMNLRISPKISNEIGKDIAQIQKAKQEIFGIDKGRQVLLDRTNDGKLILTDLFKNKSKNVSTIDGKTPSLTDDIPSHDCNSLPWAIYNAAIKLIDSIKNPLL